MTKDKLISELKLSLSNMQGWASLLRDEALDGEPGVRAEFVKDMELAYSLQKEIPE